MFLLRFESRGIVVLRAETNVQDGAVLHSDEGVPLTIGAHVTIGHSRAPCASPFAVAEVPSASGNDEAANLAAATWEAVFHAVNSAREEVNFSVEMTEESGCSKNVCYANGVETRK